MTDPRERPLEVPCPTCAARTGERCAWPDRPGLGRYIYHLSRLDLWTILEDRPPQDRPGSPETAASPGVAPEPTAQPGVAGRRRLPRLPWPWRKPPTN